MSGDMAGFLGFPSHSRGHLWNLHKTSWWSTWTKELKLLSSISCKPISSLLGSADILLFKRRYSSSVAQNTLCVQKIVASMAEYPGKTWQKSYLNLRKSAFSADNIEPDNFKQSSFWCSPPSTEHFFVREKQLLSQTKNKPEYVILTLGFERVSNMGFSNPLSLVSCKVSMPSFRFHMEEKLMEGTDLWKNNNKFISYNGKSEIMCTMVYS